MTRSELIDAIKEYAMEESSVQLTTAQVKAVMGAYAVLAVESIIEGTDISLPYLGKFVAGEREARQGESLGKAWVSPATFTMKFRLGKPVKDELKEAMAESMEDAA